ncbi:hypothetical protein BAUCODRAFT_121095 [Baudoinia panamericana UAMH 10762]|uniref:Enhancer of mRNA-decapping protein 3 n=1 Tax=Baudoinia panamericana (strain UAMH 10762) TaxID=717646 RepID=M2NGS3_BAUPA|nr:uncharacterized protein BAUCODRAFT_121095 [Baudoinia panamericana UAMH 10762]EMC98210.1 hypothetical protein BAUCODRAFT_121095 [Baudoinia panamericana UAMH 10762]
MIACALTLPNSRSSLELYTLLKPDNWQFTVKLIRVGVVNVHNVEMADFTGMLVQVTLREPQNVILHGRVRDIVAGQSLTILDVLVPATGEQWPLQTVPGSAIADLQVIDSKPAPPPASAIRTNAPQLPVQSVPLHQMQQRPTQIQRQPSNFIDPAILSYGRSPGPPKASMAPVEAPATPIKSMLSRAAENLPVNGSPFVAEAGSVKSAGLGGALSELGGGDLWPRSANLAPIPKVVRTENGADDGDQLPNPSDAGGKRKVRRGQQKKKNGPPTSSDPPPVMNVEVSRNGNDMSGSSQTAKGWRQDPLLQPSPQNGSPAGKAESKKQARRQREQQEMQNGWATEDATDVQDMGDFDFEASNKLFDKKGVFDQIRQDDTTADEDRLVSHNKVARPGTYGGKNLHPTENVLSPKLPLPHTGNEGDSSSDADTEHNHANGRTSSRQSVTRSVLGKAPSRQNSVPADGKPHHFTASISSDRSGIARTTTFLASRASGPLAPVLTASPQPDRTHSPQSAVSYAYAQGTISEATQEPHFVVQSTHRPCKVLLPMGLSNLEAQTVAQFGMTPEAVTESAARCVAQVALSMFDPSGGSRRGSRANTFRGSVTSSMTLDRAQTPVVVILAGNHAVGARAVAAARHIANRKIRVIIAEALFEAKGMQHEEMRAQTAMLKRLQRMGAPIKRSAWLKASNYIKNLTGPPAVIIDALLAGSKYDVPSETNTQHRLDYQREAREMIDWANRSRAPVLSVVCPSGVSGEDGSATLVEGEPLAVRPDKVVSLGVPMQGLLEAMKNGERWDVSLADIGVNITLNSDDAVVFGPQWVVDLRFEEGAETNGLA